MPCPKCGSSRRDVISPGLFRCRGTVTVTRPDPDRGYYPGFFQELCYATYTEADSAAAAVAVAARVESAAREAQYRAVQAQRADEERAAARVRVPGQRQQVKRILAAMAAQGHPGSKQFWREDRAFLKHTKLMTRPAWRGWVLGDFERKTFQGDMEVTVRDDYGLATDGTWLVINPRPTSYGRLTASVVEETDGTIGPGFMSWKVPLSQALGSIEALATRHGVSLT